MGYTKIDIDIEEIISTVTSTISGCCFSLLDLDGVFPNGTGQSVDNIFEEIENSEFGYIITPQDLNKLAVRADDLSFMMLIAYKNKNELIKKSNDKDTQDLVKNAYFYLDITDSQVFDVKCEDLFIEAKLKSKFENAFVIANI